MCDLDAVQDLFLDTNESETLIIPDEDVSNFLLTSTQACKLLGIPPSLGSELVTRQQIPVYTIDGEPMFRLQDVQEYDALMQENRRQALEEMRAHPEWSPDLYSPNLM